METINESYTGTGAMGGWCCTLYYLYHAKIIIERDILRSCQFYQIITQLLSFYPLINEYIQV